MMRSILDRVLQKKHYCGVLQKHITVEFCKKNTTTIGDKKHNTTRYPLVKKLPPKILGQGIFSFMGSEKNMEWD